MNKLVVLSKVIEEASRRPFRYAADNPAIVPDAKPQTKPLAVPNMNTAMNTVGGMAMSPNGSTSGFAQINLSGSSASVNQWTQFDIVNASTTVDYKLRIGSNLGLPNGAAELGLASGAADAADISDQVGAGCLGVRGFSRITCSKPVLVTEIQITSDDSTQLNSEISQLEVELDGTVVSRKINVSATQLKSDERTNLLTIENIAVVLDSSHALEFLSKKSKSVTLKLKCEAWDNIGLMVPYGY